MKRLLVTSLSLAALLVACGGGGNDGGASGPEVQMVQGQRFDPGTITVNVGDAVTWTNDSSEAHTVTEVGNKMFDNNYFASGSFPSEEDAREYFPEGLIEPGETYEFTFEKAGTYQYFCIPHEGSGMKGTIVVKP
jgi:plastocyanin